MSKLWAGRFEKDVTSAVLDYTQTTDIDTRLIKSDLWGSIAHIIMLCHQNIVSQNDGRDIAKCLIAILDQAEQGNFQLDKSFEDVHLNIEQQVISTLGIEIGGKLHTARSRNDQVVTDTRLYLREALLDIQAELLGFIEDLTSMSRLNLDTVIIGYTHGQPAQPISLAYWLTSYASMFSRDILRLVAAYENTNHNPLGSCALAGTSLPIDRQITTKLLGFDEVFLHGLDATSCRDFILETVGALSIAMSNISRMAEEIIVWSSFEFNLVEVDDAFATGSSIMPQKKNPVVAELARARTGDVYGALIHLLTMIKGVPMGYSCDLQEDKPPLWRALDTTLATISIMRQQLHVTKFNSWKAIEFCWKNFSTATELANYLVAEKHLSFREAHQLVGGIVKSLINAGKSLADLTAVAHELEQRGITLDTTTLHTLLDPVAVISRQNSLGGTSPESVRHIIEVLSNMLDHYKELLEKRKSALRESFSDTQKAVRLFVGGADIQSVVEK